MPIFFWFLEIILVSHQEPGQPAEGGVRETKIEELLRDSFGPEHLELPMSNDVT